jgi:hypothetical protein
VPPVKVIESVAAASAWQLAAVVLLVSAAVLRRSPAIATMAVGFGYVTAIFSRSGGMNEFALCTVALLAVASVGFHRILRWEAPSVLALPGSYLVYAFVLQGAWIGAGAADNLWAWGSLQAFALLFFARDWRPTGGTARTSAGERRAWSRAGAAGLLLISANLILWATAFAQPDDPHLLRNAIVVLPVMIVLGAWAPGVFARWTGDPVSRSAKSIATVLWAMATVGVVLVTFNAGAPLTNAFVVFGLALASGQQCNPSLPSRSRSCFALSVGMVPGTSLRSWPRPCWRRAFIGLPGCRRRVSGPSCCADGPGRKRWRFRSAVPPRAWEVAGEPSC